MREGSERGQERGRERGEGRGERRRGEKGEGRGERRGEREERGEGRGRAKRWTSEDAELSKDEGRGGSELTYFFFPPSHQKKLRTFQSAPEVSWNLFS
jgi:hypothetical protein